MVPLMMEQVKRTCLLLGLLTLLLPTACIGSRKKVEVPSEKMTSTAEKDRVKKNRKFRSDAYSQKNTMEATAEKTGEAGHEFEPKMPGNRIAQVSVPGPYVALTFDDGPNPHTTPQVLDILRRYRAKATFFVVGENAARYKHIVSRAASEGHEIGSHTWDHASLVKLSRANIVSQMDRTAAAIREAIGHAPTVMRPPYGATNPAIIEMLAERYGTPSILWSVDTQDWKHPGVSVVVHRAVDRAKNGSIILLHDIHASTLDAVEGVVRGLQARGFRLVTVSELIEMGRRYAGGYARAEHRSAEEPEMRSTGVHLFASAGEASESGAQLPPPEPAAAASAPEPEVAAAAAAPESQMVPSEPVLSEQASNTAEQ